MHRRSRLALMVVGLATVALAATAQQSMPKAGQDALRAGSTEIGVQFTSSFNSIMQVANIGYFLADNLEVGGGFGFEAGSAKANDAGDDHQSYTTFGFYGVGRYHFPVAAPMVPFAEAGMEYARVDYGITSDTFGLLVGGGVRLFASPRFCITVTGDLIGGQMEVEHASGSWFAFRLGAGLSVFVF